MTKEALKDLLDAVEAAIQAGDWKVDGACDPDLVIRRAKEALAQPEQEPVAYTTGHCENHKQKGGCQLHNLQCGWPDCDRKPITTPPQRKPLTDEEIKGIYEDCDAPTGGQFTLAFTRAIEAAHGIKGEA